MAVEKRYNLSRSLAFSGLRSLSGVQPDSNLLCALKLRGIAASKCAHVKAAIPRCLLVKSRSDRSRFLAIKETAVAFFGARL